MTEEISHTRKFFSLSRWSVQRKLVLAFWLVSVIPTMIAAELAATTLSQIFENNVRIWLKESTKIVQDEISEILRSNARVSQLFLQNTRPSSPSSARHNKLTSDLASAMGMDVVALIRSTDHKIVFSTVADNIIEQISLAPNAVMQTIHNGGVFTGIVISTYQSIQDGVDYELLIGTYLDSRFLTSVGDVHSLDLRLYMNNASGFSEIYSSQRFDNLPTVVPRDIEQILRETKEPSEQSTPQYSGVYSPIFNDAGELQGIIFSGLQRHATLVGMVNQTNLFLLILLFGSVLSLSVGWLISQRLTRPLRGLSEGVRAVTAGDYRQRVEVIGSDELAELSVTFNHMTERLKQLQHLEAQLRRRDRLHTLGEVAMGLAHEIRNPLGIIKTATQLLHRRASLPETDMRHLEYVISEVTRINDLITEFLDFAKPSAPIRCTQLARPLLEDLLGFCAPELSTHNIDAVVIEHDADATIYADARQLTQACLNLVLNAIDAMPTGGRLTIGIASSEDTTIISIADTGHGVETDMIERIFSPFVTTKASGTGLGLAKVFSIMENHDGRVECVSTIGQGATFNLYLPAHDGEQL